MAADQPCYTLLNIALDTDIPSEADLRKTLETGTLGQRITAMKQVRMRRSERLKWRHFYVDSRPVFVGDLRDAAW